MEHARKFDLGPGPGRRIFDSARQLVAIGAEQFTKCIQFGFRHMAGLTGFPVLTGKDRDCFKMREEREKNETEKGQVK